MRGPNFSKEDSAAGLHCNLERAEMSALENHEEGWASTSCCVAELAKLCSAQLP